MLLLLGIIHLLCLALFLHWVERAPVLETEGKLAHGFAPPKAVAPPSMRAR